MKNGISYPLAPEVIKAIEKKRKEFMKTSGFRISQARFSNMIGPSLNPKINEINIKLKPRINKRRK